MKCIICGCTDDHACDGGCSWQVDRRGEIPVCSNCMDSQTAELAALIVHLAEHACNGLIRLWDPKVKGVSKKQAADATCISVRSRRKCESCRARLLLGAV